ncbi:MAG: Dna2/Cas4 domain-containing protein, partial [Spirochaetaceae bacterium]|nr:Dna2/Cas4 domain-containing protein [Spirochaetaceae bacterium]
MMKLFQEDDLVPISALSHICYCDRRFALIHLEQRWEENRFTAEGRVLHERVDVERHESRRLFKQEYG